MNENQRIISNLERKYMYILQELFFSQEFKEELTKLEDVVNEDYTFIKETYEKKNKIDIAVERLIRFFIYKKSSIKIEGIYPSPISCDMAIETNDCILNIDSKTVDSVGNSTDINYFHFESNQSSFNFNNYGLQDNYSGVAVNSYLPTIDKYTDKPVLTFFLKIIYSDNGKKFSYYQKGNNILLTCLPNGILSDLFPNDMIFNFKTYSYDTSYFICNKATAEELDLKFSNVENFYSELERVGFKIPYDNVLLGSINGRPLVIVLHEGLGLVPVKRKNGWYLEEIIAGHTARILYENLQKRVDGFGEIWYGHIEDKI